MEESVCLWPRKQQLSARRGERALARGSRARRCNSLSAASRDVPTRALLAGSLIHRVLASERQPSEIVPPRVPLHPFSLQSQLRSLFSNLEREFGASNGPVHSLNPVVVLSANTGTLFANLARPARAAVRDALPALGSWKRR